MRRTDQIPFPFHGGQAAKEKASVAAAFYLPEHGFDDLLAFFINVAAFYGSQFAGHALFGRGVLGDAATRRGQRLVAVLDPAGCDVGIDSFGCEKIQIVFTEVTAIGTGPPREDA